jgi:adenylate kinase family enzyme
MKFAILGPTASGKSSLAVEVARCIGGTVVNGDPRGPLRDRSAAGAREREHSTVCCAIGGWSLDGKSQGQRRRGLRWFV